MGDTAHGLRTFESSAATSVTTPNFTWQKVSLGETVSGHSPHSLNIHQWKAMSSSHLASTQLICFPPIINCWARHEILQTALNLFILSSFQFILNILFPRLSDYITHYALFWGTAVAQWLRCCATNRKVAGSIPDGVNGIFHWHNPSDCTMALGSTQPLTEMSTRSICWGKKQPVCKDDNLTTIRGHCHVIWDP